MDFKYPYTDFHELNLDWFLGEFKNYYEKTIQQDEKIQSLDETVTQFTNFVTDYFDNLDVQQEINNKLDALVADGTISNLLSPLVDDYNAAIISRVNAQDDEIGVLSARMDTFAHLTDGSTTGDAELADIRVGADGITYGSAGNAVRGQYDVLNTKISRIRPDMVKIIDGKECVDTNFVWEANSWTLSNDDVTDAAYNRNVNKLYGNCYIVNPDNYRWSIAFFNEDDDTALTYYDGGVTSPATHEYTDSIFYVPVIYGTYYKIKVHKPGITTMNPDLNSVRILKCLEDPMWLIGQVNTTDGIVYANNNLISPVLTADQAKQVHIWKENSGSSYNYAVYRYDNESATWSKIIPGPGGATWSDANRYFSISDGQYVIRVGAVSSQVKYRNACDDILYDKINYHYCYERDYDDITNMIEWQNGDIDASGIITSTQRMIGKLPNNGNFEIKLNKPSGMFKLWKHSGAAWSVVSDWTYYQIRYTGDYTSEYYLAVRYYPTESTMTINSGKQNIKVYEYDDVGITSDVKNSFYGKKIAFIGDSITQGRFAKNSGSVNMVMAKPFPSIISELCNCQAANYGIGGALVYDNDWKSLERHASGITDYDYVFICGGTNDYGGNVSEADFTAAYENVVDTLKSNNSIVVAVSPSWRTDRTSPNSQGLTLANYCNIEKAVAAAKGIKYINLYTPTRYNDEFLNNLSDGLHPNEIGQKIIANIIMENM